MKSANGIEYSKLKPSNYLPRIVDGRLEKLLKIFGGVEITGTKWCGKTWTALAHANSCDRLDDETVFQTAKTDPSLVLSGEAPHLVDEWQEVPAIWDATRRHIDASGNDKGLVLLTGSSAPKNSAKIHHSGTGRIARLRMRPMSLFELGLSTGKVSLQGLFEGKFNTTRKHTELIEVALWCCRGGWPSVIELDDDFALEVPHEYIKSVLDVSVPQANKNTHTALRLMKALAHNPSQALTYKTLSKDMAYGDENAMPSANTVEEYLDLFERLFLIEQVHGWDAPIRAKQHLRTKPKRYFVDPSIDAALLNVEPNALLTDMQTLGILFESLCMRDLNVYLSALDGIGNQIYYYRDDRGLETDAIIQLGSGKWAAIEIKLSDYKVDEGAVTLTKLAKKIAANTAAQNREPEFLAVLVGKGDVAYQRDDGVYVIPVATLGP